MLPSVLLSSGCEILRLRDEEIRTPAHSEGTTNTSFTGAAFCFFGFPVTKQRAYVLLTGTLPQWPLDTAGKEKKERKIKRGKAFNSCGSSCPF